MKALKIFLIVVIAVSMVSCSKKVKKPPMLADASVAGDELADSSIGSGPYTSSGLSGDASDTGSAPSSSRDSWGGSSDGSGDQPITKRPYTGDWSSDSNLTTVYFPYNSYELGGDAQSALAQNASYLKSNPSARVLIEGHCDERGTEEYNQALGEKRALSTREYLINQGISPSRIDVISYGELRPAVEGESESTWSRNRRAEFKTAG